jgi:hypothetical protein
VFHGKGPVFEGSVGLRHPADFSDGPSETILVVEGGMPVPWTKSEELRYAADEPLPDLCTVFKGGFRVLMADGHGRWVRRDIGDATLRALITRNAGDKPGPDW